MIAGAGDDVLAVVAHPDDESFGLGGIIAALVDAGARVHVLCFTRGEASTLGRTAEADLGAVRARELKSAGEVLGVGRAVLLAFPDGGLADRPLRELTVPVAETAREVHATMLLVFDDTGVTGHPDHRRATEAAVEVADTLGLPVHAWAIPDGVASGLNREFATTFTGHPVDQLSTAVPVDRDRQARAIVCHGSQATDNPVLWRRLELSGEVDHLRLLAGTPASPPAEVGR